MDSDQVSYTPSWRNEAACLNVNPDWFFPTSMASGDAWKARKVCQACPVARECLQDAMDQNETSGIRAGLSPLQRSNLRKGKVPSPLRKPLQPNKSKTHCNSGHEFTPENRRRASYAAQHKGAA